jgi:hypothetical protein
MDLEDKPVACNMKDAAHKALVPGFQDHMEQVVVPLHMGYVAVGTAAHVEHLQTGETSVGLEVLGRKHKGMGLQDQYGALGTVAEAHELHAMQHEALKRHSRSLWC